MRRLLPVVFSLSLFLSTGAYAAQWSRIATKDKVRLEVDSASVVKSEDGKLRRSRFFGQSAKLRLTG